MSKRFIQLSEVSEVLDISSAQAYALVRSGELPAIRFGRSFRVPESAVMAAIDTHIADVG